MPQSSYHNRCSLPSQSRMFKPKSVKSCSSREFSDYERYYDIDKEAHHARRKEHYVEDEMLYKTKTIPAPVRKKSSSHYETKCVTRRPLDCYVNKSLPYNIGPSRSRPLRNMDIGILDEKLEHRPVDPTKVPMDWNNYHRLEVIHNFMDDLEYEFPSLCTTGVIGKSLEGRDLKILKISNSDASNARVWIDAGIHAREWIAPAVNTFVANYIARNFDSLPESVRNKDWYFLPVINPDGYEYSHTTDRMWRKNKAYVRHKLFGVDLNRNFSYGWGGKGSSDEPNHSFYRGPRPFSEPETSAMRDIFMNSGVTFSVYITLHSFGQVIIMPFAYRNELAPDYIRLLEGATVMSKAIYDTNGNTYKVGVSKDVMYQASGTSNDWSHGEVGIPYCYLIELRSKKHKFKLPKEEIAETGEEILNCVIALMEFIDNYKTPDIGKNLLNIFEPDGDVLSDVISEDEPEAKTGSRLREVRAVFDVKSLDSRNKSEVSYEQVEVQVSRHSAVMTKNKRSYIRTQVWEIRFTREGQRDFLKSLDTVGVLNIWNEDHSTMDIMVPGPRAAQVASMLHERDVGFSIAMPDVNALFEQEQAENCRSTKIKKHPCIVCPKEMDVPVCKLDWSNYHRLSTIYAFMDELASEYPYLCSVCCIGKTAEGREIKLLVISNGDDNNPGVWIDGAIHAREWISTAVATYIADKIVRNFNDYPDSITKKDWYILPVLNPDGYEYTHTTDRMWRKNRAQYGDCVGVDLNRNWSCGWGEKGEEGSSEDPGNIFFRGSHAFSERETAAVKHVIQKSSTEFKVFLSLHSYGEAILFPWGYTSDPCPDYVLLLEGGTAIARGIHETSGHTYKVGNTKDLMYYAAGTSIDWSYGVAKIPFSYMLELRGKQHRFLLPKECIFTTASEIFNGIQSLLTFIDLNVSLSHDSCVCP